MRIMFMGTPEIAAICLNRLVSDGHSVIACVTGEDKPRGRGKVMTPTPVKLAALEHGIPVYTPKTLRDEAFLEILREVNPELIAVVAYGKILPKAVTVRALDRNGKEFELRGTDLLARAICHECDHLDGKLYIDSQIRELSADELGG